jgi:hypothetical protein
MPIFLAIKDAPPCGEFLYSSETATGLSKQSPIIRVIGQLHAPGNGADSSTSGFPLRAAQYGIFKNFSHAPDANL